MTTSATDSALNADLAALAEEITTCRLCPRLVEYREAIAVKKRASYRDWDYWARGVPGFGDPHAKVLLLGLAPAAHGANRTGRMFTGDTSANFLMSVLYEAGFATKPTTHHRADGLEMREAYITAVARCAPPKDKPTPAEMAACRPYLLREFNLLQETRVVVALGRVAFDAYVRYAREVLKHPLKLNFGHGVVHQMEAGLPTLLCSYHPSPRNTNTGRLNYAQLLSVMLEARRLAGLEAMPGGAR